MALLLGALSAGAEAPAHADEPPVTIEVPVFEGGSGLDFYFHVGEAYEATRPDVDVDIYGDPRIADKIRVRILEGTYPEVTKRSNVFYKLVRMIVAIFSSSKHCVPLYGVTAKGHDVLDFVLPYHVQCCSDLITTRTNACKVMSRLHAVLILDSRGDIKSPFLGTTQSSIGHGDKRWAKGNQLW